MDTIMKKRKNKKLHINNFVAKHAQNSGAGQHVDKIGEKAPRVRQKRAWKKQILQDLS